MGQRELTDSLRRGFVMLIWPKRCRQHPAACDLLHALARGQSLVPCFFPPVASAARGSQPLILLTASSKDVAGGVDEDDFLKAFTDVPTVQVDMGSPGCGSCMSFAGSLPGTLNLSSDFSLQIYSSRDLEDNLNKIREILSDDKHDWDHRANAVRAQAKPSFGGCLSFSWVKSPALEIKDYQVTP